MLRKGTILRGIYRIEKRLATGGFGNTYIAINTEFDERVAIKEFFIKGKTERDDTTSSVSVSIVENLQEFEEQRDKFKKEARRIRKLNNKHIIRVYDLFEENGTAYYVMDYIDGESLADKLKRTNCPMSEQEVLQILPQILDALKTVHDINLWHLDLKPANIMMDKHGQITLIDFGASKHIEKNGVLTTSSAMAKTEGYFPPEQTSQTMKNIGAWTDIYSLGATLYNLLTNSNPPTFDDIINDEIDAFKFPSTVSSTIKDLIIWMMKPNRKQRPQSIDEITSFLTKKEETPRQEEVKVEEESDEETVLEQGHQREWQNDEETIMSNESSPKEEGVVVEGKADIENYNKKARILILAIATIILAIVIGFSVRKFIEEGLIEENEVRAQRIRALEDSINVLLGDVANSQQEAADATLKVAKEKESAAEEAFRDAEQKAKEAQEAANRAEQAASQAKQAAEAIQKSRNGVIAQLTKISGMNENAERKSLRNNVIEQLKTLATKDIKNKEVYEDVRNRLDDKICFDSSERSKGHYNILIKRLQSIE